MAVLYTGDPALADLRIHTDGTATYLGPRRREPEPGLMRLRWDAERLTVALDTLTEALHAAGRAVGA